MAFATHYNLIHLYIILNPGEFADYHQKCKHVRMDTMSEPMPDNEPKSNTSSKPEEVYHFEDWRDARRRERMLRRQQRGWRRGQGWVGGAILIMLGLIFLLQNTGLVFFQNWWALFILIPAFGAFAAAWGRYQDSGQMDAAVRGSAFGGLVMTLIAVAFLFNFNSVLFWPALLIVAGVGVLVNAMWR
jgi:hypothetical protein